MSQIPIDVPTARGYEPPRNTQFSVFLDNRVGRLLDLLEIFEGQHLTLAGLSVVDATDHAVVRLLTSNSDLARRLLNRFEHPASEVEIMAVEMGGGSTLASVCECLLGAELNIHYAYPLLVQPRGYPVVALHVDDTTLGCNLLRRHHFHLLAENDLGDNGPGSHPGTPNDPDGI